MRSYLPLLALSMVAVGCGPRLFTVTATTGNIHSQPHSVADGTIVYRMTGNLPNYQIKRINASSESLISTITLPAYSSIYYTSENGERIVVRRLDGNTEYGEVIDANSGSVLTSERLSPWNEGEAALEVPSISPDGEYIFFRGEFDGLPVTYVRKVVGGTMRMISGDAVPVSAAVGASSNLGTNQNFFFSLSDGSVITPSYTIPGNQRIYQGRDGWTLTYDGSKFRMYRQNDGLVRQANLAAGDNFVGLARDGKAIYYRKATGMVTIHNLTSGVETNLFPYASAEGYLPSLSPDGTRVTYPVTEGEFGSRFITNPATELAPIYRRTAIQPGFDAGGLNFVLHDDRSMAYRNEFPGSISQQYRLPKGDKFEGLTEDGASSFYRLGGYLYRHTPKSGQATKWFAPWTVADILFSRDGKSAVEYYQNPRVGTQLRHRNPKGTPLAFTLPANTTPLAVMPDGRVMWHEVPDARTTLRFTDPATGVMRRSFYLGQTGAVKQVSVSNDGTKFVAWANDARFGDLTTEKVRRLDSDPVRGVAISPDGSLAAVAHLDRVIVYKTSNYTVAWTELIQSDPFSPTKLAISPNNQRLLIVTQGDAALVNITGQ
ncbi:hypothetical protein EON81_19645 [bacterium]|nr:MAG: hypothetical protein EON81_19645 [bacterium]